jgi:DNA replication and repair protein RecF
MSLQQLSIASFRNLKDATLDFDAAVNLIRGDNAAGKTALIEAISVITQGKSFRTSRLGHCIRHGQDTFLIFSRHDHYRAGFRYGLQQQDIRIDGQSTRRMRDLASRTALLVIDEKTIELITGKPTRRRQFIDWLLFHVEQDYADLWSRSMYLLKQRNALLRQRHDLHLLDYWDALLMESSIQLNTLRQKHVSELTERIEEFDIEYRPGFDPDDYPLQLRASRDIDIKLGYTRYHFNRADLMFSTRNGLPVLDAASRGQIKTLSTNLHIRAVEAIKNGSGKPVIILTDDLNAELDRQNLSKLYEKLISLNTQLFVTGLTNESFPEVLADQCRMFHVEHGMIGINTA